jgi:hypothetical protein
VNDRDFIVLLAGIVDAVIICHFALEGQANDVLIDGD